MDKWLIYALQLMVDMTLGRNDNQQHLYINAIAPKLMKDPIGPDNYEMLLWDGDIFAGIIADHHFLVIHGSRN